MSIVVFKYGSLLPTETFVRHHFELLAGGYGRFMHLDNWNTPKLGERVLWGTGLPSRALRKLRVRAGATREDLHERAFAQALRKVQASAVLAEFGYSGVRILKACRQLHLPLVVHFHGAEIFRKSLLEQYAHAYKEVFSYASSVIAVSDHMKKQLIAYSADPDRIAVIPCGMSIPSERQIAVQRPPSERDYRIVSVTRMAEMKGPHLTLLAFHKYLSIGGHGTLHIIGDGPLLPICTSLAKGLGIAARVVLHGQLEHQTALELLETGHMYVQHSVVASDGVCEGMPVSIMEAAGYALPIVATKHAGISEMIVHGQDGYLVDEYDVDRMAYCMHEVFKNPERAGEMGRKARAKAVQEFDVTEQSEKLRKVILSALERQSERSFG